MDEALWTLAELAAEAAGALRDVEPVNGQVRAVPDERALRYYTTLGLLDRPAATRGRTALYGRRHLAQVVAIKRLQAAGRSLADIQALVPTLDDRALAQVSGIAVAPRRRAAARAGFWREAPVATAATPAPTSPGPAMAVPALAAEVGAAIGSPAAVARGQRFVSQVALALAPGVTLTLDAARAPSDADADALHAAAAALLAELRRRRLVEPDAAMPATSPSHPTAPVAPMSTTQEEDEGC